jgi:hypothetical protein
MTPPDKAPPTIGPALRQSVFLHNGRTRMVLGDLDAVVLQGFFRRPVPSPFDGDAVWGCAHCVVGTILSDIHLRANHVNWMINAVRHGVTDEAIAELYQDSPPHRGPLVRAPVCPPGRFATIREMLVAHPEAQTQTQSIASRMKEPTAGILLRPQGGVVVRLAFRTAAAMLLLYEDLADHDPDWWKVEDSERWTIPVDVQASTEHLDWIAEFLETIAHAANGLRRGHARETRVRGAPVPSDRHNAWHVTIATARACAWGNAVTTQIAPGVSWASSTP